MLDLAWSELLVIGVVALIVIGPKDLPQMFRALGRITARARGMAREFSAAMDDAARSSGLDEAGKTLRDVKDLTSKKSLGLDALDRAADRFEKWQPAMPPRAEAAPLPDPAAADSPATASPATTAAPEAGAAADAAPAAAAPGQRRLRAVRRSDTQEG